MLLLLFLRQAVVNEYGQTELGAVAAGVGVRHFGRIDPGVEFKVNGAAQTHFSVRLSC